MRIYGGREGNGAILNMLYLKGMGRLT